MRTTFLWTVALALSCCLIADAADKDKRRLFNTFFLEGNRVTYVIGLTDDRKYTIYTPDGQAVKGKYIASDKEIAFPYPGGMRHFEYDFDGADVKLKPSKQDRPRAGHVLGALPPIGADSRVVFVAIQNWRARGLPAEPNKPPQTVVQTPTTPTVKPPSIPTVQPVIPPPVGTQVQPPVVVQQPTPVQPVNPVQRVKPVQPVQSGPKDITGTYSIKDAQGRVATLRLREGGTFDYASADGRRAGGTHLYLNGELNLDSGFWRRHFQVTEAENGLHFSRRKTDVPKLGDPLGEMVPVQGEATWTKQADTTTVSQAGPVTPVTPVTPVKPVTQPVVPLPPPEPVVKDPKPVTPPEPKKPVPAVTPGAAPQGLAQMTGTYIHKPNPLVSETWVLGADGRFEYSDSNGAKVNGTAVLKDGTMRLQAGEVVRQFAVTVDKDGAVTFSRTNQDAPRILNDLASMSPSVLKSARYEKK